MLSKWKHWIFPLTTISSVVFPLTTIISCATTQNQTSEFVKQINQTISEHLNQWSKLAFQFQTPSSSKFQASYFPIPADLFGYQIININWHAQDDDLQGFKKITYDLKRGNHLISNQSVLISGFLNQSQVAIQKENPELDFKKQILTYQDQSNQWLNSVLIQDQSLKLFQLEQLLNDQNLVKQIVEKLITKQKFIIEKTEQIRFRQIDYNGLLVTIRLVATNGKQSSSLSFILDNLDPHYYLEKNRVVKFIDQLANAITQAKISVKNDIDRLNVKDVLDNWNSLQINLNDFFYFYVQHSPRNVVNILDPFWLRLNVFKIETIDLVNGIIDISGAIVYNNTRVAPYFEYQKPLKFKLYCQPAQ